MGAKVKMDESGNILIKRLRKLNTAALSEKNRQNQQIFGPKMALAYRITGPKKLSISFPGPNPLPLALVMYLSAHIKNITQGAV
jgi:hypothetical protein